VRGVSQGGAATSFPHQQVNLDTGWRTQSASFEFSTVVTRIASDGFYATDIGDKRGFSSVFAYNFSSPPRMRVCDRLKSYGGTASDFYGFTEIGFPTWELEEWDPLARPCLVPEAAGLSATDTARDDQTGLYTTTLPLLTQIAALVRVESRVDPDPKKAVNVHVTKNFGPGYPRKENGYKPEENATDCDLNHDGKVDFNTDPEKTCSDNCTANIDCTEYSNFLAHSAFILVIETQDPNTPAPIRGSIQADGSTAAEFDPVALRGKTIRSFTGTLRYFSGGSQFTIEARCEDDITVDMNAQPIGSDRACVHARTDSENNSASN
jgi:hypothetical protein